MAAWDGGGGEVSYWSERESELLELGRQTAAEYRSPFRRGDRVITNEEMSALMLWDFASIQQRIDLYGCCGRGRDSQGRGYGYGLCPLFLKAREMVKDGDID